MRFDDTYENDTLDGDDHDVDIDIETMLDEADIPTDNELAKLQKMLLSQDGIADFLNGDF